MRKVACLTPYRFFLASCVPDGIIAEDYGVIIKKVLSRTGKKVFLSVAFLFLLATLPFPAMSQERNVSGTVVTENRDPLQGATVTVKNTNRITTSDAAGHFTIRAANGEILIISFVGYTSQETKVTNSPISIILNASVNSMNDVVVTAL